MKVFKPINNNIVSAFNDDGDEVVVVGKGIGYNATEGTLIPKEKISKIFVMSNRDNLDKLKSLFGKIQREYVEITDEILKYATNRLNKKINESAYFTLADHISFAVSRMKEGMRFQNILTPQVKRFYPDEYEVGLYALKLLKEKMGVSMPDDEAASVALHILSALYDTTYRETFKETQLLGTIITKIAEHTGNEIDIGSDYGDRFVTHLMNLINRASHKMPPPETDAWLYDIMKAEYQKEINCCEVVADKIHEAYGYDLQKCEIGYMAVHIKRINVIN